MRHLIIIIVLAVSCHAATFAQECKVPVYFLFRYDYNQSNESGYRGGYRGDDEGIHRWDTFKNFLEEHNLTEDIKNTRLSVALNYISGPRSLQLRVSLYDTENNVVLYSVKLDTCYADEDIFRLSLKMDKDLFSDSNPQFSNVIDTIRSQIITLYEENRSVWLKSVRELIAGGNTELAMFKLAQYPACCPSYPRVQPFIAATFREYVRSDHKRLIRWAKYIWEDQHSETDARFVVALLNSEELSKGNRKNADRILKEVAEKYPTLDNNAHEDYTAISELATIAAKLVYWFGIEYGERHAPETFNYIPEV